MIPLVETVEDARLKALVFPVSGPRPRRQFTVDRKEERIYCVSCHCPGGFISVENVDNVIWLCDATSPCGHSCAETKGELTLPRLAL